MVLNHSVEIFASESAYQFHVWNISKLMRYCTYCNEYIIPAEITARFDPRNDVEHQSVAMLVIRRPSRAVYCKCNYSNISLFRFMLISNYVRNTDALMRHESPDDSSPKAATKLYNGFVKEMGFLVTVL